MRPSRHIRLIIFALTIVGFAATASARDIPEIIPLAGGQIEARFDNSCRVLYGADRRMVSVNQYCAASQVNAAIEAANRYFGGDLGSGATSVTCESRDGRRAYCAANTAGGVQLARRLSSAPCVEGRDWSFDRDGIWVDNGCRAVFEVRSGSAVPVTTVTCESRNNRRSECQANTAGGVRLARRLSSAACDQGRSWGFDGRGIWVDNGCRATFELRSEIAQPVTTVTCESRNNRRSSCQATTAGGVRLARRLSSAACDQGRSWGFDEQGIWVDKGCRAVFEIGGAW